MFTYQWIESIVKLLQSQDNEITNKDSVLQQRILNFILPVFFTFVSYKHAIQPTKLIILMPCTIRNFKRGLHGNCVIVFHPCAYLELIPTFSVINHSMPSHNNIPGYSYLPYN